MNTFKLMRIISSGDKDWKDIPTDAQKKYLYHFPEPENDIQRSYYQYKCQNLFRNRIKIFVINAFCLIAFLPILFVLLTKKVGKERKRIEIIGEFKGLEDLIVDEIDKSKLNNDVWMESECLSTSDLPLIFYLVLTYPLAPYFWMKCMLKISGYNYMITTYKPSVIFVHGEYTFTSSILTYYCEKKGVKHVNAMHGEKLFYIGYSFFHYHKCYIWDEYYEKLLLELRAEKNQFLISVPPSLKINLISNYDKLCYSKYKYYLQIFNEDELKEILTSLKFIKNWDKNLRFRPHPRFSNLTLLRKYVTENLIEMPNNVSISKSITNCEVAIGAFSTVLYQSYLCRKIVVLDDVAFEKTYIQLKSHKYILSNKKEIKTLSQFQ